MKTIPSLTSFEIGQAVDVYIADLRAATQMELDLKIFRMNRLGISQDRSTKRLGAPQQTISGSKPAPHLHDT